MALSTLIRNGLNVALEPLNLQVGTRAAEQVEARRIESLAGRGQFEKLALPVLPQFEACDPSPVFEALSQHRQEIDDLEAGGSGYSFGNSYFYSPDAEVAYALARSRQPSRITEVGSGNSTFLFRAAIKAGGFPCELTAIDPTPRRAIEEAADRIIRGRGEETAIEEFTRLGEGDFLFIDSSHEVAAGNDVVTLLLGVLPALNKGVVVHIHDIFLPFEYPREWIEAYRWTEQYLVQALLQGSTEYEVIWPAHYLQRTHPEFAEHLPRAGSARGASLWLRKLSGPA